MKSRYALLVWGVLLSLVVLAAACAPLLAGNPLRTNPSDQFATPGARYWLGADQFGRDVLGRALWGARTSLSMAALAAAVALGLGIAGGALAGTFGGTPDWAIMRLVDILLAFPGLLMALWLIALLDTGQWQAALAVGLALAPLCSRMVRAAILTERVRPYVEAARVAGAGWWRIAWWHILPNIGGQLLAFASVIYAWSLLNMAALDFLGVTGSPSWPTWGRMLAEGRAYLREAPWIALVPGSLLTLSVLAVTGVGDAWRHALLAER